MKKAATPEEVTAQPGNDSNRTRPPFQVERVATALLWLGSLTCQEAEKAPINARHLNSVMAELRHHHGISWTATPEKAQGYRGEPAHLVRYELTEVGQQQARQQVENWRTRRGAGPIDWDLFHGASLAYWLS